MTNTGVEAAGVSSGTREAEQHADPFYYGWRYVNRQTPEGGSITERVPLTYDDVLHPQEGDQVTHTPLHQRICKYLVSVFEALLASNPTAVVLFDCRIAWDVPELRPHGPDIAVIFNVRERKNWGTFDVAQEGTRPALIVEVTSPETRSGDLVTKLDEYELAGVPLYMIVDIVQRRGQSTPRLLGYRLVNGVYEVLAPDERGRLRLEPVNLWIGVADADVVCYDESGTRIEDYVGLAEARAKAETRAEAEAARAEAEARARAEAEARLREMEAQLRQLRGEA